MLGSLCLMVMSVGLFNVYLVNCWIKYNILAISIYLYSKEKAMEEVQLKKIVDDIKKGKIGVANTNYDYMIDFGTVSVRITASAN